MDLRNSLLIGHILIFGIWFGTDVATFLISRRVLNASIDLPVRGALAGLMTHIEVIARLCLPTMLALGVSLSIESGLTTWPQWLHGVTWILAIAWVALVWVVHRQSGDAELASTLAMVDLVVRSVICLVLWFIGIQALATDGGSVLADHLASKILLFALIMTTGIAIRFLLKPFSAAFGDLMSNGSTPEREAALTTSLRFAQPLVVVIWGSLVLEVALAVTKTVPWA